MGQLRKLCGSIYGRGDAAIAETAAWFWSLKREGKNRSLQIGCSDLEKKQYFDVAALRPEQLAAILDANPHIELRCGTWSAEQSVILATRPYPLNVTLVEKFHQMGGFRFQDEGSAFVDALQSRQKSFGSLEISGCHLNPANVRRLCGFATFETLNIRNFKDGEDVLVPLAAKTPALVYSFHASHLRPEDLSPLGILAKDLELKVYFDHSDDYARKIIPFMHRLAETGHLEGLRFWFRDFYSPSGFVDAIIHVIHKNPNLTYLDLSTFYDLRSETGAILGAVEEHAGLRTLIVSADRFNLDNLYPSLERLLSRNRNIRILNSLGEKITNGTTIDKLYRLNQFFRGSASLMKQPASIRQSLVTTTLARSATRNFQFTALLLSNHTDTLCELIHGVNLDTVANPDSASTVMEEDAMSLPLFNPSDSYRATLSKRTRAQSSRATKKAARVDA